MRDMRNVAAEKTMPERLDPDPARVCPAPIFRRTAQVEQRKARMAGSHARVSQVVAEFLGEEPEVSVLAAADGKKTVARKGGNKPERSLARIIRNPEMRCRRVKMPEAMREIGLDETALAEELMQIFCRRRAGAKHDDVASIASDKFLMEFVRECTRILESARPGSGQGTKGAPTVLRLVHNIPEPGRTSGEG
jgi:hypothetical protein